MAIENLPEKERRVIRKMIRQYCLQVKDIKGNSLYNQASEEGVCLEATEEAIESLLDQGILLLVVYPAENKFKIVSKLMMDDIDFGDGLIISS